VNCELVCYLDTLALRRLSEDYAILQARVVMPWDSLETGDDVAPYFFFPATIQAGRNIQTDTAGIQIDFSTSLRTSGSGSSAADANIFGKQYELDITAYAQQLALGQVPDAELGFTIVSSSRNASFARAILLGTSDPVRPPKLRLYLARLED